MIVPEKAIIKSYYENERIRKAQADMAWRGTIRPSVAQEGFLRDKLERSIKKRYRAAADAIKERGVSAAYAFLSRLLYDDSVFQPIMKMYMDVGLAYARRQYNMSLADIHGMNKSFYMPSEWKSAKRFEQIWRDSLETFLRQHGVKFVSDINETTRQDILKVIAKGQSANMAEAEIATLLRKSNIPLVRASRIARTEVTRALNAGILLGAAALPFEVSKEWITAEDEKVRDKPFSHTLLHGTILPLNVPFNNGEPLRFPGDPKGSAGNVINCRCVLAILPNLDSGNRPIYRGETTMDTDILFRLTELL